MNGVSQRGLLVRKHCRAVEMDQQSERRMARQVPVSLDDELVRSCLQMSLETAPGSNASKSCRSSATCSSTALRLGEFAGIPHSDARDTATRLVGES